MKDGITFEVKKHLAVLSTTNNYQKQANLISWNGKPESLDIRTWNIKDENSPKPLKGVILSADETKGLIEAIKGLEMAL